MVNPIVSGGINIPLPQRRPRPAAPYELSPDRAKRARLLPGTLPPSFNSGPPLAARVISVSSPPAIAVQQSMPQSCAAATTSDSCPVLASTLPSILVPISNPKPPVRAKAAPPPAAVPAPVNVSQLCHAQQGLSLVEIANIGLQLVHFVKTFSANPQNRLFPLIPRDLLLYQDRRLSVGLPRDPAAQIANSLKYHAPEVALGYQLTTRSLCWNIGVILFELFLDAPVFSGYSPLTHLLAINALFGPLPDEMIKQILQAQTHLPPAVQITMTLISSNRDHEVRTRLKGKIFAQATQKRETLNTTNSFHDLISKLLKCDSQERLDCDGALRHPFFYRPPVQPSTD
jgi:serine/threonine protein kinase